MVTSLGTVLSLVQYLHLLGTIPNKDSTSLETVGTGDSSTTSFWLDRLGIIDDTYTISYGATAASTTALTETTHYTIDLDTSEITLTTAGVTAVGTNDIYAAYKYNRLEILNSELLAALNAAKNKVLRDTGQTFTDTTNLAYRKVVNEEIDCHNIVNNKVYDLYYQPAVKLQTTVNGAFTLGGTEITLTDSSLFPSTGTINIGGNKVTYTANATNVLTVPATTPTIADGAAVRGEVIELSTQSEGNSPSYIVLDPDTEYEIDYLEGRFKILLTAYWNEVDATATRTTIYPRNYQARATYMHAWYEAGNDVEIPTEIQWVVHAIAARKLMGAVVAKASEAGMDDFNPSLINVDRTEIREAIEEYTVLNVGTSPYNKQSLS